MQEPLDINLETTIFINFIQSHKEKLVAVYEIINERLLTNETTIINKLNVRRTKK